MAAEFDKPVSGVWNVPDSVRTAACKSSRKEPSNIQMSVFKGSSSEGKSAECSTKTLSTKVEGTLPFLPTDTQKAALAAAIDVRMLLTNAMYGASNLPYPFAQSPPGSIPHFGLFSPFGLSFPPVNPITQAASVGQPVYNLNQPAHITPRTMKHKSPKISKKETRPNSSASTSYSQPCNTRTVEQSFRKNLQTGVKDAHGANKMVSTYVTTSGGKRTNMLKKDEHSDVITSQHNVNAPRLIANPLPISRPVHSAADVFRHSTNTTVKQLKPPLSVIGDFRLTNLAPHVTDYQLNLNSIKPASSQRNTAVSKTSKTVAKRDLNFVAKDFNALKSLNQTFVTSLSKKVPASPAMNHSKPRNHGLSQSIASTSVQMPNHSSLGDAEAAAILLGLRHSLPNNQELLGDNKVNNDSRKRLANGGSSELEATKRARVANTGHSTNYGPVRTEAVDLSAKTVNNNQKTKQPAGLSSLVLKSGTTFTYNMAVPASCQAPIYQARKPNKNKKAVNDCVVISSKYERKQQRGDLSGVGTVFADESAVESCRHFLSSVRNEKGNGSSTSVVTHLPSYICAFDCHTQLEGLPMYGPQDEMMLKSQQGANNGGFNFKKDICKKFTQSMSTDTEEQWESMHECGDVCTDDAHDIVFEPSVISKNNTGNFTARKVNVTDRLPYDTNHAGQIASSEAIQMKQRVRASNSVTDTKQKAANPISVSRAHCDVLMPTREKPAERAIDFRVKKRSSGERQRADEIQSKKSMEKCKPNQLIGKPKFSPASSAHTSGGSQQAVTTKITSSTGSQTCITKDINKSKPRNNNAAKAQLVSNEMSKTAPSFSDLREKSKQLKNNALQGRGPSTSATTPSSFGACSSARPRHSKDSKQRNLPGSNLYRVRNSTLGDSNDSLDSIGADSEAPHDDSDVMSDSSYTSCESGYSRRRADSSGSDVDTDHDLSDPGDIDETPENDRSRDIHTPPRPRFTLNQPKFTLNPGSTFAAPRKAETQDNPATPQKSFVANNSSNAPSGSKIKIRKPTFTFSSEHQKSVSPKPPTASSKMSGHPSTSNSNDTPEKSTVARRAPNENVPELKCDEGDSVSFKAMFIRALNKGNQKEGLAVDGKSLRALLGEATCFYHNNKKYVLKRGLTKIKPREGFIADAKESSSTVTPRKSDVNNNHISNGRINQSPIEPRMSVTAVKQEKKLRKSKIKIKKDKKKRLQHLFSDNSFKKIQRDNKKRKGDVTATSQNDVSRDVTHKRHRRMHEIENLIFEGAGGMTPIPDLSLRDSDVFSNIKLRRREAAKRGIVETPREESTPTKKKKSNKSKERKRLIKTAALERAVVNKSRKHSMEKKLRKYKKRNRIFHIKKIEIPEPEVHRTSCVRINAGVPRTHLEVQAFAALEIQKFRKKSISESETRENEVTDADLVEYTDGVAIDCKPLDLQGVKHVFDDDMSEHHARLDTKPYIASSDTNITSVSSSSDDTGKEMAASSISDVTTSNFVSHGMLQNIQRDNTTIDVISHRLKSVEGRDILSVVDHGNHVDSVKTNEDADEPRYPRRIKTKPSMDESSEKGGGDADEEPSDINNCESDSVRSASPLLPGRAAKLRKRNPVSSQGRVSPLSGKVKSTKLEMFSNSIKENSSFRLLSFFPIPSAITLGPAFGDLQPSYSVKRLKASSGHLCSSDKDSNAWKVGRDAQETKQHLQREVWRNMTLNMFSNDNKTNNSVNIHNSR